MTKYLYIDHGGVLDGEYSTNKLNTDDLLLANVEDIQQILPDGKKIIAILNDLVDNFGFKIAFQSKSTEEDQIKLWELIEFACKKANLKLPKVECMGSYNKHKYSKNPSTNPAIQINEKQGIRIAAQGQNEKDGKVCLREALQIITKQEPRNCIVLDDGEPIIKQAIADGYEGYLIGNKQYAFTLFSALDKILSTAIEEKKMKINTNQAFKEEAKFNEMQTKPQICKTFTQKTQDEAEKQIKQEKKNVPILQIYESMLNQENVLEKPNSVPFYQVNICEVERQINKYFNFKAPLSKIIRKDEEFRNSGLPRPQFHSCQSLISAAIFLDKSGRKWLGSSDLRTDQTEKIDQGKSEAQAIKAIIASDIYRFYGAISPDYVLSKQYLTNYDPSLEREFENKYSIHLMSKVMCSYETQENYQSKNNCPIVLSKPSIGSYITLHSGKTVLENGFGRILAIAAFINDVNVLGLHGENIGFTEFEQKKIFSLILNTEWAFDSDPHRKAFGRKIHVASSVAGPEGEIEFDKLNKDVQMNFIETVYKIKLTSSATIEGFFNKKGNQSFAIHFEKSTQELTEMLKVRREELLKFYQTELIAFDNNLKGDPLKELIIEDLDKLGLLEQSFYQVEHEGTDFRVPLEKIFTRFLKNQPKILLIHGPAGSGKSLGMQILFENCILEYRKNNKNFYPILCQLKDFNANTMQTFLKDTLQNYYPELLVQKDSPVIIFADGYDEIGNNFSGNIYQSQNMTQFPNLKFVISCRSEQLPKEQQNLFIPNEGQHFLEVFYLQAFSQQQIESYLKNQCLKNKKNLQQFKSEINLVSDQLQLKDSISNPLILRIMVYLLPEFLKNLKENTIKKISSIFKTFLNCFYWHQSRRLDEKIEFGEEKFINEIDVFSKQIAFTMHVNNCQAGNSTDKKQERFFEQEHYFILSGCPLVRKNQEFSFLFPKLQDQLAAQQMIKNIEKAKSQHITQSETVKIFLQELIDRDCEAMLEEHVKQQIPKTLAENSAELLKLVGKFK